MIDWNRIDELRAEIGAEDFCEVAGIFLQEIGDVIATMQQDAPVASLAEQMHFVKGGALNLGFTAVAALASDGEALANAGRTVDVGAMANSFEASKAAFLDRMGEERAA